jgi:hypothetical protein
MLAQLSALKLRLTIDPADTVDDTILTNFLKLVSGAFEKECNRLFTRTVAATFEFSADKREIIPDHYPIESITALDLKTDEATGWISQTLSGYLLRNAAVISLGAALGTCNDVARITYTGGYVLPGSTPTGNQTALPDELREACIEQSAYLYQNRKRLGLSSVSSEGGSIAIARANFLPLVADLLKQHTRITL